MQEMLEVFKKDGIPIIPMSTMTEEGVMTVKTEVRKLSRRGNV